MISSESRERDWAGSYTCAQKVSHAKMLHYVPGTYTPYVPDLSYDDISYSIGKYPGTTIPTQYMQSSWKQSSEYYTTQMPQEYPMFVT